MKNFLSHSLNIGSVLIRGRNSDNPDPISEAYAVLRAIALNRPSNNCSGRL